MKWLLIGLAVVVAALLIAAAGFSWMVRGMVESQNRVVPVQLGITPAAQALQAKPGVADGLRAT